jgi:hypothetical protein
MKIRRVNGESGQSLEVLGQAGWGPLGDHSGLDADLVNTLKACAPMSTSVGTPLPFQPRSYRDFMLFERHYIQAARGYLRRFRPSIGRLASAYELVMRRTFPPLKPAALWYRQPIYYMGNHLRFVPDGAEIPWPNYTDALDYELELGFFLSKPLLDATPKKLNPQ